MFVKNCIIEVLQKYITNNDLFEFNEIKLETDFHCSRKSVGI